MENGELLQMIASMLFGTVIAVISYFLKRLISEADALESRVDVLETDTNKKINKIRERAIHLEAQNKAYDEKLTDVKATLDKVGQDIVWIREKLASRN